MFIYYYKSGYQAIIINNATMSEERINKDWQCTGLENNLLECDNGNDPPPCVNTQVLAGVDCDGENYYYNYRIFNFIYFFL